MIVKNTTEDVRKLTNWDHGDAAKSPQIVRNTQSKISRDFSAALQAFQRVQKEAAERTKISTERELSRVGGGSKPTKQSQQQPDEVHYNHQDRYQEEQMQSQQQVQLEEQIVQPHRMTEAEMAYQDGLIEERDNEIRDIET